MDFVVDNFLTAALDRLLAAKGLHGLRHYGMIWHGVYGRKPLLEPGDVARLRYRALIDSASQLMATELKTDMIQVASTEILTGLQTGLLDGGETNQLVYVMTAIDSQAPHWTATHHTASMLGLIAEKSWWNRLTPEQQAAVEGGYPDRATARAAIRADGMSEIARAAARGAIVHDLPPDARARWRAAVVPTYKRLIEASGDGAQDIFDLIREGQRAYAARANR
jgi:TRAP-type C4-dicarboxylate transport system substrate-binding protein